MRLALIGIVLAGLAIRLLVLRDLAGHACFPLPELVPDVALYHRLARILAAGNGTLPADAGHSSTLWAHLLGIAYALGGDGPWTARFVNVGVGLGTILLVYALAARLQRSRAAGLVAAAGAAVFGPFVFFDTSRLKVSLGLFLAALALLVVAQERDRPHAGRQLGLGALLGLALDVNAFLAPVVLLALVALPRTRGLAALARIGAGLLVVLGLLGLVSQRSPAARLAHAAVHLYVGNHAGAWGGYAEVEGLRPTPAGHVRDARRLAEENAGRPLEASGVAAYWAGRLGDFAWRHPDELAALLGKKALLVLSAYELPNNENYQYWQRAVPLLGWLPGFGLLLPLGLGGAVLIARRGEPSVVLVAAGAAYAAGLVLVFVTWRYRAPLALVLWPLAGGLAADLTTAVRARHARRRTLLAVAVASGVAAISTAGVSAEHRRLDMQAAVVHAERCERYARTHPR